MINFRKSFAPVIFLAISFLFSACEVPKELEPIVAGDAGRAQLLQKSIALVNQSIQWGDPTIAVEAVSMKIFPKYYPMLIGDPKSTRVLESTITEVTMDATDPNKATSQIEIKVYGSPTYAVRTLTRKESWEFSRLDGGWKLTQVEVSKPTPVPSIE